MKVEMRGFGTCYRHKGTRFWWIQYFRNGKRFRESTASEKLKDAKDLLKLRIGAPLTQASSSAVLAVGALYDALDRDYVINKRHSLMNLRGQWTNHLEPFFGSKEAARVDSDQIARYIERRLGEKASNATVNRELAALKRMYKLAMKASKLERAPFIEMLKESNARAGFLKDGDYQAMAQATAAVGLWLRAMFEIAYTFGWRKGELLSRRVKHLDLAARTLRLEPGETKNGRARTVHLTGAAFELLRQSAAGKAGEDWLFTRAGNRPVLYFRRSWSSATRAAGVEGLLFHDLRRSAVSNMVRDGVGEKQAMAVSGHLTRAVFDRYHILDPAQMREAVRKMERGASERAKEARQRELFQGSIEFPDGETAAENGAADRLRTVTAGKAAKPN
jgi:integrase